MQIKDDWEAFTVALAPLLTAFGPYAAQLSDLIVRLAKARTMHTYILHCYFISVLAHIKHG